MLGQARLLAIDQAGSVKHSLHLPLHVCLRQDALWPRGRSKPSAASQSIACSLTSPRGSKQSKAFHDLHPRGGVSPIPLSIASSSTTECAANAPFADRRSARLGCSYVHLFAKSFFEQISPDSRFWTGIYHYGFLGRSRTL